MAKKQTAKKAESPGEALPAVEKDKGGRPPVAAEAMDVFGLDAVCERISEGLSLTGIAAEAGVSKGTLLAWLAAVPDRSACAREARAVSARHWDEQAEQELRDAADAFELAKARELASHFRWRAKAIAPKEYGDKVQVGNDPDNPMPTPTVNVTFVRPG